MIANSVRDLRHRLGCDRPEEALYPPLVDCADLFGDDTGWLPDVPFGGPQRDPMIKDIERAI